MERRAVWGGWGVEWGGLWAGRPVGARYIAAAPGWQEAKKWEKAPRSVRERFALPRSRFRVC